MAAGIVYRLWPGAPELYVPNKYALVNRRLKTIAELMGWLFECVYEIYGEDNPDLCDWEHPYFCFEIIW